MQLGDPGVLVASSGEAVTAVTAAPGAAHEGDNGGDLIGMNINSGEEEKGMIRGDELGDSKINGGGNRWPRQETLALLKIRSEMDAVFRDSSLKGPLWEEVSRKMAALGCHRTAKKCKEKFENVYKYHKRTKESRSGKPEGKSYRFFDQLQALETQFTVSNHHPLKPPQPSLATNTATLPTAATALTTRPSDNTTTVSYVTTVPTTNPTVISPSPPPTNAITITSLTIAATNNPRNPSPQSVVAAAAVPPFSLPNMNTLFSTTSTSSSTASDEDLEERYRKKRKWKDYFRRLTRQVLAKQEEMQKRFLDAIDNRERERVAQQEAWRMQEMARINREHEILVQERSTATAKDAAVIAFLQMLSGQQSPIPVGSFLHHQPPKVQPLMATPQPISQVQPQQLTPPPPPPPQVATNHNFEIQKPNNGDNAATTPMSSSRWPNAEVHALIRLRTNLDCKYQENGPKGPLWEEISIGMQRLGHNRSAKRCKEKWENINKYFKKMKESNKQRREDSKTCPYYHELEALYKEKRKIQNLFGATFDGMKPNDMMEPLMVQPEQQWRPPPQYDLQQQAVEEGIEGENNASEYQEKQREINHEEEGEEDDEMEEDEDSVEDEEGRGVAGSYEIATNKLSSVDTVECDKIRKFLIGGDES